MNATYEVQKQAGGTCYAYASARVMLNSWRRVPHARLPSLKDLVALIVEEFGDRGGNSYEVLKYFGNPKKRRENNSLFGWKIPQDRDKYLDYFELPTLRLEQFEDEETLFRRMQNAAGPREMVVTFRFTDRQWDCFSQFFKRNPTGTLGTSDLPEAGTNEFDGRGHAVVLDGDDSSPGHLVLKNSWGKEWAANGTFSVASLASLSSFRKARVIDVVWTEDTIGQALVEWSRKMSAVPAREGSLPLPLLTGIPDFIFGKRGEEKVSPMVYDLIPVAAKYCTKEREKLKIDHPNIIEHKGWMPEDCIDSFPRELSAEEPFETQTNSYLLMERADQNLRQYLTEIKTHDGGISTKMALKIMTDVCQGLLHLHSKGIAHCDLKPENILLVGNTWKICDFGCARMMSGSRTVTKSGTDKWTAPEILSPQTDMKGRHLGEADSYSCGKLLKELGLTNRSPILAEVAAKCLSARNVFTCRPTIATILKHLTNFDAPPKYDTILEAARFADGVESIVHLANNGVNVKTCDSEGRPAVYIAAQNGHSEVIKALASFGANISTPDKHGAIPVVIAFLRGHKEVRRVAVPWQETN